MNGSDRFLSLLQTLLTRRERDRSPLRTARVLGRHQDGTERILRTDAACVTRAARDNHYAGTVIVEPNLAAFHRAGSAGIPTLTEVAAAETLWVEKLTPAQYHPGHHYEVTVTGRGFDDRVRIDFLLPDPFGGADLNPDIEVLSTTFIDAETLALQIAVSPHARLLPEGAPISYGRV